MFIVSWLFDRLGYMPKINVDVAAWPFSQQATFEEEKPKKTAKKTVKIHKATTRKPKIK